MTIQELTAILIESKSALWIEQRGYEDTLSPKERYRVSRNHRPHGGWGVPGNTKWTRAMKAAKCPTDVFWQGKNPTPSTQMPHAFIAFLQQIDG
jgi:hypothetical protein